MKKIISFLCWVFLVIVSLFYNLMISYIILDVGKTLSIGFITNLTLIQMYGLIFVIRLIIFHQSKNKENNELKNLTVLTIYQFIIALVSWGLFYLFINIFLR